MFKALSRNRIHTRGGGADDERLSIAVGAGGGAIVVVVESGVDISDELGQLIPDDNGEVELLLGRQPLVELLLEEELPNSDIWCTVELLHLKPIRSAPDGRELE